MDFKSINDKARKSNKIGLTFASGKYISIGLETFLPIILGALAGNFWIDKVYNTTPLWTIILALFGFVVGMYSLFKTVFQINKEGKTKKIDNSINHNSTDN